MYTNHDVIQKSICINFIQNKDKPVINETGGGRLDDN